MESRNYVEILPSFYTRLPAPPVEVKANDKDGDDPVLRRTSKFRLNKVVNKTQDGVRR